MLNDLGWKNGVKELSKNLMSLLFIKLLVVVPVLYTLSVLTDDEDDMSNTSKSLCVFTALKSHPPSLRVFRGIFEIIVLLYCAAFALMVWEKTLGAEIIGNLLFQISDDEDYENDKNHHYERVQGEDNDNVYDEEDESIDEDLDHNQNLTFSKRHLILPPSPASVAGAATDLLLLFLICLLLFTYNHKLNVDHIKKHMLAEDKFIQQSEHNSYISSMVTRPTPIAITISGIAAPMFPLILFFVSATTLCFPWHKRVHFFHLIRRTVEAPFFTVTFRDGFIGDILTSTVRPMQDLAFTFFYLGSGLQGWWSSQYNLDEAAAPVEHSWLVYTVVLPACIVSPLWWRFLQNLRQAHDAKQRWPYLGNAFKYFLAAQVALFGVFTPSNKKTFIWIMSFVIATLYQIWWDTFMDWALFVPNPKWSGQITCQPFSLRPNRLYKHKSMYYVIFLMNFLLRFCWTLSFLPPQTLSRAGAIINTFTGSEFQTFARPIVLATAEIIRRTVWAFLRVELEVLKSMNETSDIIDHLSFPTSSYNNDLIERGIEMKLAPTDDQNKTSLRKMTIESSKEDDFVNHSSISLTSRIPSAFSMIQSDMSSSSNIQIMGELCLWATAFTSVGIIAAAYRQ